jgi:hypothetical protein|nr:MAG TPA: hypothetical protein [Caudoviricetes sp.]
MTRKQLIAEILTDLKQYDESGLIDYRSLNMWIKNELKRFGVNITVLTEKVLDVDNGKAELPEDFWTLHLAVKCKQEDWEGEYQEDRELVQDSQWYKQSTTTNYVWDNQSQSHKEESYKTVEEKVFYKDRVTNIRYKEPVLLRLTKGFKKEFCAPSCRNMQQKLTASANYEINILGNVLQTNFKEGNIYMQYNALPTDESGDIYIPDVRSLQEYLMYYAKRKVLESLWINDDDVNLINKLQYIKAQEKEYLGLAMTQVKMEGLGNWDKNLKKKMIAETNRFERMFPNL